MERLKQLLLVTCRNTDALILHFDNGVLTLEADRKTNGLAGGRVFDGVVEEIDKDDAGQGFIQLKLSIDTFGCKVDGTTGAGGSGYFGDRAPAKGRKVNRRSFTLHFPGADLAEQENFLDQIPHPAAGVDDIPE